jgi:ketosteroid isomerase-like protein
MSCGRAEGEVQDAAVRYLTACVTRDVDYIAANSATDGSFTGTTSGCGQPQSLDEIVSHLRGLKKAGWSQLRPTGFVAGDFAWFTDHANGVLPDGNEIGIRTTLLMRRIDDGWKVVHFHVSEGVERVGIELSS